MRAVIIATEMPGRMPFADRHPACLLPLVDRPFLQHLIERLVEQGFDRLDLVLHRLPDRVEGFLGDGTRWGVEFRYHLARDGERPYAVAATAAGAGGPALLVHADHIVLDDIVGYAPATGEGPVSLCWRQAGEAPAPRWTGWAWLPAGAGELAGDEDRVALEGRLRALGRIRLVSPPLRCVSAASLLEAHHRCLSGEAATLHTTGREIEPGLRVGCGARIDRRAELRPPVFVGAHARVGAGVRLGPYAAVGAESVLERGSRVRNAVVLPGTLVGRDVDLQGVLADHGRLASGRLGAEVRVADGFLLGRAAPTGPSAWVGRLCSRVAAGALLVVTWPLLLVVAGWLRLTGGAGVFERRAFVRLPLSVGVPPALGHRLCLRGREPRRAGWAHFLRRFVPGLGAVLRGDLRFVGVDPRTPAQLAALPADWRELYGSCWPGLVSEALVHGHAGPEDRRACDCWYAARGGGWHDLGLLTRYVGTLLSNLVPRWAPSVGRTAEPGSP